MNAVPSNWKCVPLSEIAEFIMGQAPPGSDCNRTGLGTPFVKAGEFGPLRPSINEWTTNPLKTARQNDVLICVVGATCGKINLGSDCAIGRSVAAIRPDALLDQKYLFNFLKTKILSLRSASTGSAQGVISKEQLGNIELPLAPLAEQRRIVAKIDSLSAKSSRARDHLGHVPRLVEQYRRAVLADAFGVKWNGERFIHSLPCRELGSISEVQSGVTLGKKRSPDQKLVTRPYLRVANVQRGWLSLNDVKHISVTREEAKKLLLQTGDILMNEGGDRDKLGRGWVWSGEIENCIHQNHVFRVRLNEKTFPSQFISYFTNEFGQHHFFSEGTQTTNLASISKSKLSTLMVPYPPVEEAARILQRIETAFAWIDRLTSEASTARKLIDHLDQALLSKAFRGELVPQDPNDEPASVLLERIKEKNSASPPAKRGRGRPRAVTLL